MLYYITKRKKQPLLLKYLVVVIDLLEAPLQKEVPKARQVLQIITQVNDKLCNNQMSTYLKRLQFYVKNAMGRTSTKQWSLEESQPSLQVKENQDLSQFRSSNVPIADTSIKTSSQKKYNPLTDSYSGIHDYE